MSRFSTVAHFKVPFFGYFIAFISLNRLFYFKKTAADQQPKTQALWDKIFLYRGIQMQMQIQYK